MRLTLPHTQPWRLRMTAVVCLVFVVIIPAVFTVLLLPRPTGAGSGSALITSSPRQLAPAAVDDPLLSPDGRTIVYTQTTGSQGGVLFQVPFAGGEPLRLNNPPAPAGVGLVQKEITDDSRYVLFTAHPWPGDTYQLYRSSLATGTTIRLNANLPAGNFVTFFRRTADGTAVVYEIGKDGSGWSNGLFVVPLAGGQARQLNSNLTGTQVIQSWWLSADSTFVVYYLSEGPSDEQPGALYRASLSGGAPVELGQALPNDNNSQVQISPDSQWVVFERAVSSTTQRLFRVASTGGAAEPIAESMSGFAEWAISLDSASVIYQAFGINNNQYQLYRVPLTATSPIEHLSAGLDDTMEVAGFRFTLDGSAVVFRAATPDGSQSRFYRAPLDGGAVTPLTGPLTYASYLFLITPDSSRLVYFLPRSMLSVPLDGSAAPVAVISDLDQAGGRDYSTNYRFSADGRLVIFRGRRLSDSGYPLFAARLDQANSAQVISGAVPVVGGMPLTDYGAPFGFVINPTASQIVFRGSESTTRVSRALYAVSLLDPATSQKLWLPLASR